MSVSAHLLNAFLLTVVLIVGLGRLADRIGLVDEPSFRKLHAGNVPLIGGVAMFTGFLVAAFLYGDAWYAHWPFLTGLLLLVGCGTLDDFVELRASTKLIAQIAAALAMIVPGWHVVGNIGDLFGFERLILDHLALPFSVLLVVGLINAFNMADGLDGLAGGLAVSALLWLGVATIFSGLDGDLWLILLMMFAALGFLIFNMRSPWRERASVFMGDAGSMMLGAGIAYFIIAACRAPFDVSLTAPAAPSTFVAPSLPALLWVVAIPVIDTLSLIGRRLHAGASPFAADRRHLHHILLDAGLPPATVTALIVLANLGLGGLGVGGMLLGLPDIVLLGGLLLPFAIYMLLLSRLTGRNALERGETAEPRASYSSIGEQNP